MKKIALLLLVSSVLISCSTSSKKETAKTDDIPQSWQPARYVEVIKPATVKFVDAITVSIDTDGDRISDMTKSFPHHIGRYLVTDSLWCDSGHKLLLGTIVKSMVTMSIDTNGDGTEDVVVDHHYIGQKPGDRISLPCGNPMIAKN
jgi:hypothetical protein